MSEHTFPYSMTRCGIIMRPEPSRPSEAEGVCNPAAVVAPDGRVLLYPRVVGKGNRSQVLQCEVLLDGSGTPCGVERKEVVLSPERGFEHGLHHGGVEDPRITFVEELGVWLMAYAAYGPLGPRAALAVSQDLKTWERLGLTKFSYEPELETDLDLFPNKDVAWFPRAVLGPDGSECLALLHRPMWETWGVGTDTTFTPQYRSLPAGLEDERASMWISYVHLSAARADLRALSHPWGHRQLAACEFPFEEAKLGAGTPPLLVPEGWLLLHHGVSMSQGRCYSAGGLLLEEGDPTKILARSCEPLLAPETSEELVGTVGNVVFPTGLVELPSGLFCFYGMADAAIGVARVERSVSAG